MPWFLALTVEEPVEEFAHYDGAVLAMTVDTGRRRERVLLDCCSAGCLCPPRLENSLLRTGKQSSYLSATGGKVQTSGQQVMTFRTVEDNMLIAHDFEVAKVSYRPDVMIMSAGNITSNGCRIILDDDGSYIESKANGTRIAVNKRNNIYELMVDVVETEDSTSNLTRISEDHSEAMLLPLGADGDAATASADEPFKVELTEARAIHHRKTPRQPTVEQNRTA